MSPDSGELEDTEPGAILGVVSMKSEAMVDPGVTGRGEQAVSSELYILCIAAVEL